MHRFTQPTNWIRAGSIALLGFATTACNNQVPATSEHSDGNILRGKTLLAQYQCGACHAIPGVVSARGIAGPPLDDFGRRSYIAGHIPNRADLLAQWIVEPRSLVPTTTMPSMGVSKDDARDMAAYLHTLR